METQLHKGKLSSLEYKVLVSYPDVTYGVEKRTVRSFEVRTRRDVDPTKIVMVLLLGSGAFAAWKLVQTWDRRLGFK